ncbi:cupin domain-containing protein [Lapillicoccus jejuensis]|uniref:DUF985 domain-containing protein n=1 Tax=Lapillicoccus jejuensis TaxID=402171 RepID=A0A542E4Y3_9MICO|nr:cupin domain-containing protein [Lapillicoccus jejuensis]TQJ10402.1 hypothetical protein FB458_3524 [Lapillicoccus jejuensis]
MDTPHGTPDGRALPPWAAPLGLRRHPEGGWYAETWRSEVEVPGGVTGLPGPRAAATAIHFLLLPGEESAWHRVRSAELWLLHRGALELSLGGVGARPAPERTDVLGPDLAAGQRLQLLVPAGHWQAARPLHGEPCLVSCVVAPGFDFADFELA